MATLLTQAVVLNKQPYQEADSQLILYTLDQGKIAVVAKGALKIKSKLNAHLEFFLISQIMLAPAKSGYRLAGAQIQENYSKISQNITKTILACYYLECLQKLVRFNFPDAQLLLLVRLFFKELQDSPNKSASLIVLNKHLFDLLSHLGYCPLLKAQTQLKLAQELHAVVSMVGEQKINSANLLFQLY